MQTQTLNISVDFNQLLSLIKQCDISQKIKIAEIVEKDTYKQRFQKLIAELSDNDLTMEDITKEVEQIRESRYSKKTQFCFTKVSQSNK